MKKIKKILGLTIVLLSAAALPSLAQVAFDHVGVGVSYWNRTYSGTDERSFLPNYPGEGGFNKGGILPYVSAGLYLYEGLGIDGRIGIWSGTFTGEQVLTGGLRIAETIKQSVIPLTVGVYYAYNDLVPDQVNVFAGAGVNRYFIQNKVERNVSGGEGNVPSRAFNGNDYGYYFKLGAEYMLTESFSVVLDGRYNMGSYDKTYTPEVDAPSVTRNIALQGLEIGLGVRYKMPPLY